MTHRRRWIRRAHAEWHAVSRWTTWCDLRPAVRVLHKAPVLAITTVGALAVAITIACVGYTVVEQMYSAELPFARGDRFVRIEFQTSKEPTAAGPLAAFQSMRGSASTLDHIGAIANPSGELMLVTEAGTVAGIRTAFITPDTMRFLPYAPLVGRSLIRADGSAGAEAVVLIRESLWQRHFERSPSVIGQTIELAGTVRVVVGVMPDELEFPSGAEAWLPLDERSFMADAVVHLPGVRLIGILRDGVTHAVAETELQTLIPHAIGRSDRSGAARVSVVPFAAGDDDLNMTVAVIAAVVLLAVAAVIANVAVLMIARGSSRTAEFAVRAALGADRARIVGQLTVEMILLGGLASLLGVLGSIATLRWIDRTNPEIPFWIDLTPGPSTYAFVAALTIATVTLAGSWPAVMVTRGGLTRTLRRSGPSTSSTTFSRLAGAMITLQIAVAVALLTGAVSMARAFLSYAQGPSLVNADRLLTARINLPLGSSPPELSRSVVAAVKALPSVIDAGVGTHVPRRDPPSIEIAIDNGDFTTTLIRAAGVAIGPGFLEALEAVPTLGRLFTEADSAPGALPVALVNRSFVAHHLRGRNPLGAHILATVSREDGAPVWREIVGVVPDLGLSAADPSAAAGIYTPLVGAREFRLIVRTSDNPGRLVDRVRSAIAAADPAIRLREIVPLDQVGSTERRFLAGVSTAMLLVGATAVALSTLSVYALLSFAVSQQTRELGIRIALGATPRRVVARVLLSAAMYVAMGTLIGGILGAILVQARTVLALRVPTGGLALIPGVVIPLVVAALLACWMPTRRALSIQPIDALKTD